MDSNEVQKLAETLKRQGLAASMTEALEKARNIMGVTAPERAADPPLQTEDDSSIIHSDKTINELLSEAGVSTQDLDAQQQALLVSEISQIKTDIKVIKRDLKKPEVPSEKVIEKIHHVADEIDSLIEMKEDLSEKKAQEHSRSQQRKPEPEE